MKYSHNRHKKLGFELQIDKMIALNNILDYSNATAQSIRTVFLVTCLKKQNMSHSHDDSVDNLAPIVLKLSQ